MAGEYYPQGISPQSGSLPSGLAGFQGVMAQGPSRMQTQADYELGNKQLNLAREQGYMQDSLQRDTMNQQRHFQWNLAEMEADQRRANRELQKYLADQQMKYYNKSLDSSQYLTERGQDLTWDNAEADRAMMKDYMAKLMALAEARNLGTLVNGEQTASQDAQGKGPASEASAAQLSDYIHDEAKNSTLQDSAYGSILNYTQAQVADAVTKGIDPADSFIRLDNLLNNPIYPVGSEMKSLDEIATGDGINNPELAAVAIQAQEMVKNHLKPLLAEHPEVAQFARKADTAGALSGIPQTPDLQDPSAPKDNPPTLGMKLPTGGETPKTKQPTLPGPSSSSTLGGGWLGTEATGAPKDVKSMVPEILAAARAQGLSRSQIMAQFYKAAFNPVTKQYDRAKARQFVFDLQNRLVSDILKIDPQAPVGLDAEVYGPTPGTSGVSWPSGGTFPPLAARPGKLGIFSNLA